MRMRAGVHQREDLAELRTQRRSVIAHNRQAAAAIRPIEGEGCDDGVAAGRQGHGQALDIAGAILWTGQKMKGRPIMPEIIGPCGRQSVASAAIHSTPWALAPKRACAARRAPCERSRTVTSP